MENLDILLSLFCPDDRDVPTDVLAAVARRVLELGVAEYDVAIAGSQLAASCVPLVVDAKPIGVMCTIENPVVAQAARERVRVTATPVAVFDEQRVRRFANPAWETFGAADDTVLGAVARVVESREAIDLAVSVGNEHVHGVARPFASAVAPFRGVVVVLHREIVVADDTTALAEAELVNRQKDQFIATVAHELRAPLAVMLLWERVLRDEALPPATREKALDAIRVSANTQSQLVADLLDVSRAINGKLHLDKHPVSIGALLDAVLFAARPYADEQGVDVTNVCQSEQYVLGDANRLRQVFANLVTNAIKCTEPGGKVTVRCIRTGDVVEVAVEDTGRGIAPEVLPQLFEPFRQVMPVRDGGLGLGLVIAAQLVRLHGGALVASSPGLGRGATFRVSLPHAGASGAVATPSQPRLGGVHVLVVDDDRRVLEALQLLLERAGAIVETALSADAGIGAVERVAPDIVLSDIAMPDGDGCSMIRRIRERESGARRVPAVAITAHVAEVSRERALDAGFDRYLTKPVDVDHLISTIAGLVHAR